MEGCSPTRPMGSTPAPQTLLFFQAESPSRKSAAGKVSTCEHPGRCRGWLLHPLNSAVLYPYTIALCCHQCLTLVS